MLTNADVDGYVDMFHVGDFTIALLPMLFVRLCFCGVMVLEHVFRVATDLSGMDMPMFALRNLKVSFRHVFACDVEPACCGLTAQVHKPDRLYDDIATRPFSESDAADLYMEEGGAPCQPFSTQGLNRGSKDPRCLARYVLRYFLKKTDHGPS